MIEAEQLTRYYGSFPALQDASFTIDERQIVGFLGLNGAGKSTLLKILGGLLLPSSGRVVVGGADATESPDAMRRKIGFLPEEPPLYREMRVEEFLRWVGEVKGVARDKVEAELPDVMERCHLTDVSSKVIGELSHGYRKRVGIAQAIVHRPEVVILDEPISGLDPKQIVEMRNVVRGLKQKATVLISSHILSEVALTCDRVLVIHGGRIVADWSERELGKTVADGSRLTLTLRGRPAAIDKSLADAAIVKNHTTEKKAADQVEATVELDGDRREDLVRELVHAGFGVREMHDTASELERLFLELTQRPKAKA